MANILSGDSETRRGMEQIPHAAEISPKNDDAPLPEKKDYWRAAPQIGKRRRFVAPPIAYYPNGRRAANDLYTERPMEIPPDNRNTR